MEQSGNNWRCLSHSGPEWEMAESMGAERPCRIPGDDHDRVLLAMAEGIDDATLLMLATDRTTDVVTQVARRPSLSARVQERIASHPEHMGACLALAKRDDCDPAVLRRLASHIDWGVRRAVAVHLGTPWAAARQLAEDEHDGVAVAALWHPALENEDRRSARRDGGPAQANMIIDTSGNLSPAEIALAVSDSYTTSVADARLRVHLSMRAFTNMDTAETVQSDH